ncbi:MAG: type II secretion system protein [Verrucomicrobiota bacterium]
MGRPKWGFTAVELLAVIAIVGILAAMLLVLLNGSAKKPRPVAYLRRYDYTLAFLA